MAHGDGLVRRSINPQLSTRPVSSLKVDRSKTTAQTPLYIRGLARHLKMAESVIYRAFRKGYQYEFPMLRMSTPAHFLAWASQAPAAPSPADVVSDAGAYGSIRVDEEERRLKQSAAKSSRGPRQCRRPRGAGKSHAPQSTHDSQTASHDSNEH